MVDFTYQVLTGEAYLQFLETNLPTILEDISSDKILEMFSKHNGPVNFSKNDKCHFNNTYIRQ